MNRKKKINQTLKAKLKKKNAKLQTSNKPKYISKAERAAIAAKEAQANGDTSADSVTESAGETGAESVAENITKSTAQSKEQ
ncbi:MAG: DUF2986 domain-containing protein [Cognaticolwellia sp.]